MGADRNRQILGTIGGAWGKVLLHMKVKRRMNCSGIIGLMLGVLVGCACNQPAENGQLVFLVKPGFKGEVSVVQVSSAPNPRIGKSVFLLRVSDSGVAPIPNLSDLPRMYQMKAVMVPSPQSHRYSPDVNYKEAKISGGSSEVNRVGGSESRRRIYYIHP